ncbi:MAG TPA: alpha/beta fold hydrolase [Solirubrobacteraceae bacterium]|nr:alpha/beta fold hydrolase [Solirubrobacteraceae bacterium]
MQASFTASHRAGSGEPLVCIHGFTDTWRTWELVLPALERRHDVLAVTLAGHAGGPPLADRPDAATLADALERAMDDAGFERAHIVGNSLGGYVALQLAARGRARSLVALAPAGGWAEGDQSYRPTLEHFIDTQRLAKAAVPYVDQIVATPEGRRTATQFIATNYEHIPAELIAHQMLGVANCQALAPLIELALREGWSVDTQRIECPARVVWGTADRLLPWPAASARFREELARADWIELEGVGHCPQLDVPARAAELILGLTASC